MCSIKIVHGHVEDAWLIRRRMLTEMRGLQKSGRNEEDSLNHVYQQRLAVFASDPVLKLWQRAICHACRPRLA
jgi:hypothetical protein